MPNSVDHAQVFAPKHGRQAVPTVGLMYSRARFKGVDVSLKAIEIARRTYPDMRVIAFGTQPPNKDLPLPRGASFHLRPAKDKLREIYASCDVWFCGSRTEGVHLPPSEAMACRTPVVSTRVGGPMDVIENGANGYVVDVEDAPALAARLTEVLSLDHPAWRAMSDAAWKSTQAYNWEDAGELFECALREKVILGRE